MADPKGEIIARPIKANFMEGLHRSQCTISTHGAGRVYKGHGAPDCRLGYLTASRGRLPERLIVREEVRHRGSHRARLILDDSPNKSVAGRVAASDIAKPIKDGKPGKTVIVEKGAEITMSALRRLVEEFGEYAGTATVPVRSVLKCRSKYGLCRACYGTFLATSGMTEIGVLSGSSQRSRSASRGRSSCRPFRGGASPRPGHLQVFTVIVIEIFESRQLRGAATLAEVASRSKQEADRAIKVTA